MSRDRLRLGLGVGIGVGIAARLLLPWLGWSFLIERLVSDDAFYYMTIARNMTAGLGATFDGITPTNGFHPLWLGCLLPIYALAGHGAELPLRLALALGALFSAGSVVLLGIAVRTWTGNSLAGWLAAALLALNPYAILEGANGLETSLALLMLSAVLLALAHWRSAAGRSWIWLGVAGGALVLARSDMVLVLAGLYLYLLCFCRARFWSLAAAGGITTVLVALWMVWSRVTVGTFVQSSAVAIPWLVRARMGDAIAAGWLTRAQFTGRVWRHFVETTLYQMLNYAGIGLLAGLFALLVLVVRRLRWRGALSGSLKPALPGWLGWGAAGTLLMLLLSEFVRFSLREWYIAPLSLWGAVLGAGLLAGRAEEERGRWMLAAVCALVVLAAGGQAWRDLGKRGRYWFQMDQLAAAEWIAANTPREAIVGSWTAGIYGYFSQRRVVNLDGVVNWDAVHAYRARDLSRYIRAQHIGWIVDFDEFVGDFTGFFGVAPADLLTPVAVFEEARAPFGKLVVYEVEP